MDKSTRKGVTSSMRVERCRNPWNGRCRNTDIELYIVYKGRQLPICRRCWSEIAERNVEWEGGDKPWSWKRLRAWVRL